jgi:hypothetical protein
VEPDADIFPYIDLFLGLDLISLVLRLPKKWTPSHFTVCSYVKSLSPNISILNLKLGSSFVKRCRSADELSLLACSFPRITKISAYFPLAAEAIKHLSTLPHLTSLFTANDAAEIVKAVSDAGLQQVFPSLTTVMLTKAWPALCIEFLQLIQPAHLKCLYIHLGLTHVPQAQDILRLFVSIRGLCSHSQLETFIVSGYGGPGSNPEPLTHDVLEPLFAFKNLSTITSDMVFPDFDTASLKRLAIAWPKLQHLVLHTCRDGGDCSKVCLEGLTELVTRCPDLNKLTIELHISASNLESWKTTHRRPSRLRDLDFCGSTFYCDAAELGRSLRTLFPKLTRFNAYNWPQADSGYSWDAVARHLGFPDANWASIPIDDSDSD